MPLQVKQTLYGGTRNGKPVGGARYYMSEHFFGRWAQREQGLGVGVGGYRSERLGGTASL